MAITPRTIFSNPAAIALATVSTLALGAAVFCFAPLERGGCHNRSSVRMESDNPCTGVRQANGFDRSEWSEYHWFRYASCFDERNDSTSTIAVASQGLGAFPRSEVLYNLKGYHQIKTGRYDQAIKTLQVGLRRVGRPTSSTMANNLAWAGLWSPRDMKLTEARGLYRRALRVNPNSCETLHTGMWVEFGISQKSTGFERVDALKSLNALSRRYAPCFSRYKGTDPEFRSMHFISEVYGAAFIINTVNYNQMADSGLQGKVEDLQFMKIDRSLTQRIVRNMSKYHRNASANHMCREAVPFAENHHDCVQSLQRKLNNVQKVRVFLR